MSQMKGIHMKHNRNDGHNKKLQILIQPNIGLNSDVRHAVVVSLNNMLANEVVLALKTRNAYWNVSGAGSLSCISCSIRNTNR